MCKPLAITALFVAFVALMPGCSRMTWEAPQVAPEVHPEQSTAAAEESEVTQVADDFLAALAGDHLEDAYLLLTDDAQKALGYEQFDSDLTWLGVKSHKVIAQAVKGDAAYVVVRVEAAPKSKDVKAMTTAFGLLLRATDEGWRISFFAPHAEVYDAYPDLALEEVGEGRFKVTYTEPDGAPFTLTVVELAP